MYGVISNRKLKENITNLRNYVEDLKKTWFLNYNPIIEPDDKLFGYIAQEIKEIFPGLVNINNEGKTTVKASLLNTIGLKVIQELIERIEILENEL